MAGASGGRWGRDGTLIFYDTTSLHFEVDEEDAAAPAKEGQPPPPSPLRKRGKSKNGRGDAPQIVIGLAVTRDGLPVRCWIFPGNTVDVSTVAKVKADLRGWKLSRCVFVGDAGMISAGNLVELSRGGGRYLLATPVARGDKITTDVIGRAGRYREIAPNLHIKEVWWPEKDGGERRQRYVVCFNPEEAERVKKHRAEVLRQLEAELATLRVPADGHSQRICEMRATARYKPYLTETKGGGLAIDKAAITAMERLDGKWVVTSNDDTLSAEDMALGYKQLLRVEECWRTMKSGLEMRPVYHHSPARIRAHVRLCVLALLIERIAETRCKDTWSSRPGGHPRRPQSGESRPAAGAGRTGRAGHGSTRCGEEEACYAGDRASASCARDARTRGCELVPTRSGQIPGSWAENRHQGRNLRASPFKVGLCEGGVRDWGNRGGPQ